MEQGELNNSHTSPTISEIMRREKAMPEPFLKPIFNKRLPNQKTSIGNEISFINTIGFSHESVSFNIKQKIAEGFQLSLDDNKKIQELLKNKKLIDGIKRELLTSQRRTYVITEIFVPKKTAAEIKNGYEKDFFPKCFGRSLKEGVITVDENEMKNSKVGYIGTSNIFEHYDNIRKQGIYGDAQNYPTYFTTDYRVAMSHLPSEDGDGKTLEGETPTLIEISIPQLMKYRQIFRDPESLNISSESGKTFITFYGIPSIAIKRIISLKRISPQI